MQKQLVDQFRKQFGAGAISTLSGDDLVTHDLGFIPTGNFAIDSIIGRPGIPLGRVVEFYGQYASGKSTTVAGILGKCQQLGGMPVLFDTEHAYSSEWSRMFGIDPDNLLVVQPGCIEDAFMQTAFVCQKVLESNFQYPVIIAFDSISALPMRAEVDAVAASLKGKDEEKGSQWGAHAKYLAESLRVFTEIIWNAAISLVFVSQEKQRIGHVSVVKLGGDALNFHAAVQIKLTKAQPKTEEYTTIKARCVKNKVGAPFKEAEFKINFETGIDDSASVVKKASELGIVSKGKPGWYNFGDNSYRAGDLAPAIKESLYQLVFEKDLPAPKEEEPSEDPSLAIEEQAEVVVEERAPALNEVFDTSQTGEDQPEPPT